METPHAVLNITAGPNSGDTLRIDFGTCRLVGRHLSESETALMDTDGNRLLDTVANDIISTELKSNEEEPLPQVPRNTNEVFAASVFDRGPDITLGDDSISRAHAMIFYDSDGLGVVDLASTNGTFVDTERVSSSLVENGHTIQIGNSILRIQIG